MSQSLTTCSSFVTCVFVAEGCSDVMKQFYVHLLYSFFMSAAGCQLNSSCLQWLCHVCLAARSPVTTSMLRASSFGDDSPKRLALSMCW